MIMCESIGVIYSSTVHEPLHDQIWKCCNLRRHLCRVMNHYTNKYGSAVIYAVNFTMS